MFGGKREASPWATFFITSIFCIASLVVSVSGLAAEADSRLVRVLTGRNETIRLRAIAELENAPVLKRQSLDDLVAAITAQVADTDATELARPSTSRLINLIGTVDSPESETLLIELLDASHTGIAMLSADVLGKNKFYGAIEFLKKQIDRPEYASSYGFRFNLLRAIARMEHPDAIEFLTSLQGSLDGQLRFQIDEILKGVEVGHFHGDEERFADWKTTMSQGKVAPKKTDDKTVPFSNPQDKVVFKTVSDPESLLRVQLGRAHQYYGIDIHAKRLMFIIDHSGSMKNYWRGMSRLEVAKKELIKAIQELPPDSEFAILFYHSKVNQWRNKLSLADEKNKLEAIAFVRKLSYGCDTNTYGALRTALEFDDNLEAVYLLTDGRPTAGRIISPVGIVNDILHRNQFRHLNFNTIGIALAPTTEAFLRRLADESAGEFRAAE